MRTGMVAAAAAFVVLFAAVAVTGIGSLSAGASGSTIPPRATFGIGAKGDVDCDAHIGLNDVVLLLEAVANVGAVDADCVSAASVFLPRVDINCDGVMDGVDGLFLLLYLADLEQPLPNDCPPIGAPLETSTPTFTSVPTPTLDSTATPVATPTPTASPPLSDSVVNTTADHAPDGCHHLPGDCTLREAILALTNGGLVSFDIPGAGPHVIKPTTALPAVVATGSSIDGYTQGGAIPNSAGPFQPTNAIIKIVIDGSNNEASAPGLYLFAANITVRGLSIINSPEEGIKTGTLVGGMKIAGNYIGLEPDGTTVGPNALGIELRSSASGNIIGGSANADRNVISGNDGDGIWVNGGSPVVISGNWVGTNAAGTAARPNGTGIHMDPGTGSAVGGNSPAAGNLVSGNDLDGVSLTQTGAGNINVKANRIGTAANGTTPLGNGRYGVYLATGAHDNTIGGEFSALEQNIIAFNDSDGVALAASAGVNNYIDPNLTFGNGGLGTDLLEDGVSDNDVDDPDAGPNSMMNFPVITAANYDGATLTFSGTINSEPGTAVNMFIFANSECDPSGYGEGERFLRSVARFIPAEGLSAGTATFDNITTVPNPPLTDPTWVTMSASDPESSGEFSLCFPVTFTP